MIDQPHLNALRRKIRSKNDELAQKEPRGLGRHRYFYERMLRELNGVIEPHRSILHVKCGDGHILAGLRPSVGVGVDDNHANLRAARRKHKALNFVESSLEDFKLDRTFDYVIVSWPEDMVDIKAVFDCVRQVCHRQTRILVVHYHYLWSPVVRVAERLRLKSPQRLHNWVSAWDVGNLLRLSGCDVLTQRGSQLVPVYVPVVSALANRIAARLPVLHFLTLLRMTVARAKLTPRSAPSVSVVIPCRNEAGNIEDAAKRVPVMGSATELVFCDDRSTDGTPERIREMIQRYPEKRIRLVEGPGISKAQNVWTGFDAAENDILMILDADLTVLPEELPYFYEAIARDHGEFVNGSRMTYPMHQGAMRMANAVGNKGFSVFISYLLGQRIRDTLCGTKVLWRADYARMKALRGTWGVEDRWGDYELLFGAAKRHLKIVEVPIHYVDRIYGETKMTNRAGNGWRMLRLCMGALAKIKFC